MLPLLKGDTPLARSNGGEDLAKTNKAMIWEGDGIFQCVHYPTKYGFHLRPTGIAFRLFLVDAGS
jgi:hypothetical protein